VGSVGQGVFDFAAFAAFEDETSGDETTEVFAGRPNFDLQLFTNLAHTEFRVNGQELEDLDAAMVGKPFDHPLQSLGS
jgi:hypothetical protein